MRRGATPTEPAAASATKNDKAPSERDMEDAIEAVLYDRPAAPGRHRVIARDWDSASKEVIFGLLTNPVSEHSSGRVLAMAQCLTLALQYNSHPIIALLGTLTLCYYWSVNYLDESLSPSVARSRDRKPRYRSSRPLHLRCALPLHARHARRRHCLQPL
jgi:hypothetical protein